MRVGTTAEIRWRHENGGEEGHPHQSVAVMARGGYRFRLLEDRVVRWVGYPSFFSFMRKVSDGTERDLMCGLLTFFSFNFRLEKADITNNPTLFFIGANFF